MELKHIIQELEQLAPSFYKESYDNVGLLVGDSEMEITGALLSLDCTEAVIDEAMAKGCNLIISHHPIIFSGLKKLVGKNYVERAVIKAIKNDIALYACHTNLDNMHLGVNAKIAEKLGLTCCSILEPKDHTLQKLYIYLPQNHLSEVQDLFFKAGAGQIGEYSECCFSVVGKGSFKPSENANPKLGKAGGKRETTDEVKLEIIYPKYLKISIIEKIKSISFYEEIAYEIIELQNLNQQIGSGMIGLLPVPLMAKDFLELVKSSFKTDCIRYTTLPNTPISKVAICGGAGSFLLQSAKNAGAHALVTADFKYHEFFDADNQIVIADIGHYESEQFTPEIFYSYLQNKIANFALQISTTNTNPIQYF
jgi:dinuclear metal center YbgI/SA1388 family protein